MESRIDPPTRPGLRNWMDRRLTQPLLQALRSGATPSGLSMSLSIGTVLACFPVLGTTTLLCAVVAVPFRLNMVAIQVANWLAYPLQIALLIPFYQLGNRVFARPGGAHPDLGNLIPLLREDPLSAFSLFGAATAMAIGAWALCGIPAALILYRVFLRLMSRLPSITKAGHATI